MVRMSIETKIVAEFYARLFPWIDHRREVFVCRDDGGAGTSAIADLCFHFVGARDQFRAEFKTVNKRNVMGCTTKQVKTWQGALPASPHVWVAIHDSDTFLFWPHDDPTFRTNFATGKPTSNGKHVHVKAPTTSSLSMSATFIEILKYAQSTRLLS